MSTLVALATATSCDASHRISIDESSHALSVVARVIQIDQELRKLDDRQSCSKSINPCLRSTAVGISPNLHRATLGALTMPPPDEAVRSREMCRIANALPNDA